MKSQSSISAVLDPRCSHRTAAGRQCRQLSADSRSGLCAHHRDLQRQKETDDLYRNLLARCQNFQTAQGVNFALANIYRLLAANRISPRRASVLAYLNSLLLRTLPAIDYDHKTGHTDPTAPKKNASEVEEIEDDEAEAEEDEAEEDEDNSSPTFDEEISTTATPTAAPVWDSSVLEPDPTKKPS